MHGPRVALGVVIVGMGVLVFASKYLISNVEGWKAYSTLTTRLAGLAFIVVGVLLHANVLHVR